MLVEFIKKIIIQNSDYNVSKQYFTLLDVPEELFLLVCHQLFCIFLDTPVSLYFTDFCAT